MKIKITTLLFLLFVSSAIAQNKFEREHRIRKVQFPEKALGYIQEKLTNAKRIKYYREIDSSKVSFAAKFKKDRLWYSIEFAKEGGLEGIEILIKPIDIPDASFAKIEVYLKATFSKYRIRRLKQQYPISEEETAEATVKNAFQNLMLPEINYELLVSGKKEKGFEKFEILFDSEGNLKSNRKSLPPNYDHVLY